jgi:type IV secretion system protein VirB11
MRILTGLSLCLQQNLNKVINLKVYESPEAVLKFLVKELSQHDDGFETNALENLKEEEYLNWYDDIFHLKYLSSLIKKDIIEVVVHAPDDIQVFYQNGKHERCQASISQRDINLSLELFCMLKKKRFSYEFSFCSFQTKLFDEECRFSISHCSTNNSSMHTLYCRKVSQKNLPLTAFETHPKINNLLKHFIKNKFNILISGATASGKTSLIRSVLKELNEEEHIVIIEDTKELAVRTSNTSHLVAREGIEDDIKNFCHQLLRMRPDRIVLGEIRSDEVIPLLLNLNCGHRGLLTTIHANSAIDTIERVATLIAIYGKELQINYTQTLKLICRNIDFVIHMEKGKIKEIINVLGNEEQNIHFEKIY